MKTTAGRLRTLPDFEYGPELARLVQRHGAHTFELVAAVIEEKIASKDDAARCYGDAIGIAYVDPFASLISEEAIELLPAEIARKASAIPLYVIDGIVTVAMAAPTDDTLLRRLAQITKCKISPVFALPREIEDAIAIHYSSEKNLEQSLEDLERSSVFSQPDMAAERIAQLADTEGLVRILDEMIYFALRERATDIHIEPHETQSRVRFRIDGNLREVLTYSRKLHRAIISRLKILSNLNISESRFPQDGRFTMPIGTTKANFRFSSIPTHYGEKAVIRILASTSKKSMLTLDKMLMSQTVLQPFRQLAKSPNGIIFVTGPTGSGKTTTLYSALHEINDTTVNIATIEDPIEIQLHGVNQSQVNSHIDLKFATLLRSLLRQDPDIILIGEIRDLETAKIATEAALTGHLVFATLHTNTAAQAIVRLMEIGVEPYMVAPAVVGVMAQRLCARICEACKEAYFPTREELSRYFQPEGLKEIPFYRGRGCTKCRGTGYHGRVAVHELLVITEEIRTLISERRSAREINQAAAKVGFRPLRYDGLKKVLLGLTTIEEVEQNTGIEWAT